METHPNKTYTLKKTLVIDDHLMFREGLTSLLLSTPDFEVIGEAGSVREGVEKALQLKPDIILMDFSMPDGTGLDATRLILEKLPKCKIVFLTVYETDENILAALRAGAKGYLFKNISSSSLIASLRNLDTGELAMSRKMMKRALEVLAKEPISISDPFDLFSKLTPREVDVLHELENGSSTSEIAKRIHLSDNTVKNHIHSILKKLGVNNRREAILIVREYRKSKNQQLRKKQRSKKSEHQLNPLTETTNPRKLLSRITAGIVHDMRSGLGIIRNTIGFMSEEPSSPPKANEILKISRSLDFCEAVLRNLSVLGGQDTVHYERVNLETIFHETCFMLEKKFEDVKFVIDSDNDKPIIQADGGQIKQVFMNLIKNAGEAMPDGGILTCRFRMEKGNMDKSPMIRIDFQDTGRGITKENKKRLFRKFFTTKNQGYGIGLYIVHTIIERHNGVISVESEIGKGTTFTLFLPIQGNQ